ncbi:unnamed protein product, partial [Amoebophrya sp. A25]
KEVEIIRTKVENRALKIAKPDADGHWARLLCSEKYWPEWSDGPQEKQEENKDDVERDEVGDSYLDFWKDVFGADQLHVVAVEGDEK